ncbi:ABC transporter ATP-binding protein [Breznakiella homolactica]|uniref:ABC transporter ATP-binding protein n=1 Tax=Breznakiella homolactica TaxID=2798577 RepID=A0A7T7XQ33_9SPIR|nr:ABC transporter ATP-binding protein [Breznakiella homolactica]QQO10441.1 ABC transporter ATP-binding protein [Breznakiella homolactica]
MTRTDTAERPQIQQAGREIPLIAAEGLTLGYPSRAVVFGINLSWSAGQGPLAICGPNGSGKTTFLKTFLGLIPPLEGSFSLLGCPAGRKGYREALKRTAWVPQQRAPGPLRLTVRDTVSLGRNITARPFSRLSKEDSVIIDETLETCGIGELSPWIVQELSGGQYQRVSIARALAGKPDILFLDEPTTFLDQENRALVIKTLEAIIKEGKTSIVLISHDPDLCACCSLTWYFSDGRVFSRPHHQDGTV